MATAAPTAMANGAATAAVEKASPEQKAFIHVRQLLQASESQLAAALPKGIPVSYMIRVVLTAIQRTPDLLNCHPLTLLGAVFQAAQLGLVPDGMLGQAYLVPFNNTKKHRKEVQFIPGYRGLVTLARRSGEISTIDADIVRQKDHFKYVRGIYPVLEHIPCEEPDAGPIVKVYAFAKLKDGGFQIKVMTRREVEAIKARSAAVKSGRTSPWDTDPEWMFKKTAIKQLTKLLPVSTELQRAVALDDRGEVNLPQDLGLLADPDNETATPEDEDGGGSGPVIDSVDAELALVPEDHRRAIEVAFDALGMNKATRLVQLRTFKDRPAELVAMLTEMVRAQDRADDQKAGAEGASPATTAPAQSSSSPAAPASSPKPSATPAGGGKFSF